MSNYVHLIVTPGEADSLARAVGTTPLIHSQYVNRLHGRFVRLHALPRGWPRKEAAV